MKATVKHLVAMAHVADVQRSADFYSQMGFRVVSTFNNDAGVLCWVDLRSGDAALMLTKADAPVIAGQQAILFYLYADNLTALRKQLLACGIAATEITYPFYMEKGEIRVEDPDGYVLLIGQSD
jgi:catechol 2,3-dioxygenase-like lactoylglutathione lyase family enzyme